MADVAKTSQFILDKVGGPENITSLTHCATRLRFQLVDQSKVDQKALDNNPDVLGVVPQGSTGMQVIMGGGVAEFYKGIMNNPAMGDGKQAAAAPAKKEYGGVRGRFHWVDYAFEVLSDTFRPVLWALLGASLIITALVLCDTFGIQDFRAAEQPPTFQFLHAMWRSVFYFLPIMVGATAAKKLGANEWVGAAIPAALMTPEFIAMKTLPETVVSQSNVGTDVFTVDVFGLPMVLNDYGGQVFPPLLAAVGLLWVERLFKKLIPSAVHMVFVPFFSLLIMIPATAFIFGPIGIGVGNGISNFLNAVNETSPFILSIVIPLLYPFLVPLGLHWPLNAIMIQNLNSLGYDFIQGPMGAWNFACFGTVAGVFFLSVREKNVTMRQVSLGGLMAGLLGGISEPSLYGVLLRFRRSYMALLPGCALGGAVIGFFNVKASAFVFTSLLTIPAMAPAGGYALGIAVAFATSFLLVVVLDYRTKEQKAEILAELAANKGVTEADVAAESALEASEAALNEGGNVAKAAVSAAAATATATAVAEKVHAEAPAKAVKPAFEPGAVTVLTSPLEGKAVALADIPDPAFASGALGQGVAIWPTNNTVVAPADGTVLAVQSSGHAVGLQLDSGVQLLIHVGIDTVTMNGDGFEVHVEKKQKVKAGDPLITFDPAKIEAAGFPTITPVLVSNTKKFASVEGFPAESVDTASEIIRITAK